MSGKRACVAVVGASGTVGGALIKQIQAQAGTLESILGSQLRVVGVANTKNMLVSADGVDDHWREKLKTRGPDGAEVNLRSFGQQVATAASAAVSCGIIVDCSASEAVPCLYTEWMHMGLHIVTPNKKFGAGPLPRYHELKQLATKTKRQFMYEATVGAGLPIISTLKGLLETGDRVTKIEGILSGTLSYIFNTYRAGMDVARKVVILARECGVQVELDTLVLESLVPEPLVGLDVDEFMAKLPEYDGYMAQRASAAEAANQVVRYVGSVDVVAGKAAIKVASYDRDHPFAQLGGSDNIVVFETERYKSPLIVRGPGAGTEVTAAGVFFDIIQIVRSHRSS
ncbi:homoserine dehydrogenase [Dunaliella salina]|uniref:homoserine dehydrogenase n=1 Tax=Dunaliella salina TaxID=3046 RepID=A0ABQ7GD89_DUNSA|nr:homoserine dehydrogenase [Dunaliella salina]|eukprot:KAF5832579.1 homoserine dehydrogenase [Dunaliella salina]